MADDPGVPSTRDQDRDGGQADAPGPVERDLGRAELMASSAVQNSFAVSPLLSILMIPVANGLTALQGAFRRWRKG